MTLLQPLMSDREVAAAAQRDAAERQAVQRVSEMILSASPESGLPVIRLPPPSIVPEPTKPMLVSRSPQIIALWKWLWP